MRVLYLLVHFVIIKREFQRRKSFGFTYVRCSFIYYQSSIISYLVLNLGQWHKQHDLDLQDHFIRNIWFWSSISHLCHWSWSSRL